MKFIKYLLYPTTGTEFRFYIPLIVFIFLLFAGAVAVSIIYNRRKSYDFAFKRLFRKTSLHLSLFAIFFITLMAVRYEGIPYFTMRLWLFLAIIWFGYFVFKTIKHLVKDYPREKENVKNLHINSQTKTVHRYLPNKHKR